MFNFIRKLFVGDAIVISEDKFRALVIMAYGIGSNNERALYGGGDPADLLPPDEAIDSLVEAAK